ncbi:MAG TPA: Gfo/Idh/MocA family oxidoreductase [Phycisphaerae bacterium]|nr:Gfo/Idh/MocA family oxidoreductase [Phycisphaerae bacterium]
MAKKLKVGIIGVGAVGTIHANALTAVGQAELAAFCDINAERLKEKADKFGVAKRFEDYRKLLACDLDAVYVCVWNSKHRDIAVAALKAGKHVFVEKPMAMNARQASQIVAAARASKRVLQVGMVWRQDPASLVVRDMVAKGQLGSIYHVRAVLIRRRGIPGLGGWFTTKGRSGGGPLIDCGVHWLDIAMHLSGLWKPTSVSARTYAKFGPRMRDYRYVGMWAGPPKYDGVFDVEDYSTGLVRFADKATMSFEVAWAANARDETFVDLLGDKGGVRVLDGKALTLFTEHGGRVADIAPQFDAGANFFDTQARKFLAACRGECPPAATGDEGVTVMKLIDAIYASSKKGREVPIR